MYIIIVQIQNIISFIYYLYLNVVYLKLTEKYKKVLKLQLHWSAK